MILKASRLCREVNRFWLSVHGMLEYGRNIVSPIQKCIWNFLLAMACIGAIHNAWKMQEIYGVERDFVAQHLGWKEARVDGKQWLAGIVSLVEKNINGKARLYYWYPLAASKKTGFLQIATGATYFLYPCRFYTSQPHLLPGMDYVVVLQSRQRDFEDYNRSKLDGRFHFLDSNDEYLLYQNRADQEPKAR